MRDLVERFIQTTNAFDVEGALTLFAPDAVIDDASVGDAFVGSAGIRAYVERFFVGYNTISRLISLQQPDDRHAVVRLNFTGDFAILAACASDFDAFESKPALRQLPGRCSSS